MSEKKVSQYVALALSPSITEQSHLLDYFLGHRKNISVLKSSHSYHAEHLPFLSSDHVPQNRANKVGPQTRTGKHGSITS